MTDIKNIENVVQEGIARSLDGGSKTITGHISEAVRFWAVEMLNEIQFTDLTKDEVLKYLLARFVGDSKLANEILITSKNRHFKHLWR